MPLLQKKTNLMQSIDLGIHKDYEIYAADHCVSSPVTVLPLKAIRVPGAF